MEKKKHGVSLVIDGATHSFVVSEEQMKKISTGTFAFSNAIGAIY